MLSVYPFYQLPNDAEYEPPIDLRWGVTDELCGSRRFSANRVIIPPNSNNQHHYHLGCEAMIYFTHGNWRVFKGADKTPQDVAPGSCVHIPVGEPHSYANVDPQEPAYELAFYGMIPHRRFAKTIFIDDTWTRQGKVIKADPNSDVQEINAGKWKSSDSEGPMSLFGPGEGDVDRSVLPNCLIRWLVSKDRCNSRELVAGVAELSPGADTGFVRFEGAEAMFFLLTGNLEAHDQVNVQIVAPESFIYLPQGQAFRIRNPAQWAEAKFFVCCGGINKVDDIRPQRL
jgi:mannose-6-phosphate isomerase-like protein (cupin superfamily)